MSEKSQPADQSASKEALTEQPVVDAKPTPHDPELDDSSSEDENEPTSDGPVAESSITGEKKKKKKRSKKSKLKAALTGKNDETLSTDQLHQLLEQNPALKQEVEEQSKGMSKEQLDEMLKRLDLSEILTGLAAQGKNKKDTGSHKFWMTQPVPAYEEKAPQEDGPIKLIDPNIVEKDPAAMYPGFDWVTMDLEDEKELAEVYDLLSNHYVEDDEAMFRFHYSSSFFDWALRAPGWRRDWHVGVRATHSRKLVAFISAIPVEIRVRQKVIRTSEINFLCIHKKLRGKRLAPVLIKEITRRSYLLGIYQGLYTAGVLLPKPVSTCRYFHRSLNWEKLYEVGFSPMPPGSTVTRQVAKYKLPPKTSTSGLRPMEAKDVDAVLDLLKRYLDKFDFVPVFTREEVEHWLLHKPKIKTERVVWAYVVEDKAGKISDFVSFYCLESTVIASSKHKVVKAAYLYYYATEAVWDKDAGALKTRLNALMHDTLILAREAEFDVFNALTLLHNPLFLEQQKFGPGDGQLHYYLFNYRTAPLLGGVDAQNNASDEFMGGVGIVML